MKSEREGSNLEVRNIELGEVIIVITAEELKKGVEEKVEIPKNFSLGCSGKGVLILSKVIDKGVNGIKIEQKRPVFVYDIPGYLSDAEVIEDATAFIQAKVS